MMVVMVMMIQEGDEQLKWGVYEKERGGKGEFALGHKMKLQFFLLVWNLCTTTFVSYSLFDFQLDQQDFGWHHTVTLYDVWSPDWYRLDSTRKWWTRPWDSSGRHQSPHLHHRRRRFRCPHPNLQCYSRHHPMLHSAIVPPLNSYRSMRYPPKRPH